MYSGLLLLLLAVTTKPVTAATTLESTCDRIELNSFYDSNGRHVYDQIIFWHWYPDEARAHVGAWVLHDPHQQPPVKNYANGVTSYQWLDKDTGRPRRMQAPFFHASQTQIDPERADKKTLDEQLRCGLPKFVLPKAKQAPPAPEPDSFDVNCLELAP